MIEGAEDLRILRLAKLYEDAYHAFIRDALREQADPGTREKLAALLPPQNKHVDELERQEARLRSQLRDADAPQLAAGVLADIVDVERATREFYFQNADRIHDPALAQLFRELARDGTRQGEIAEAALDDYRRKKGISRAKASSNGQDVALWEGTGDLGPFSPP